jgi:hypothetical protein
VNVLAALLNFASHSSWERFLWAPVALILAVLCLVVALSEPPVSQANRVSVSIIAAAVPFSAAPASSRGTCAPHTPPLSGSACL